MAGQISRARIEQVGILSGKIESRIKALGLILPEPPKPVASYVPFVNVDNTIFISGQVPMGPKGLEYIGRLGVNMDLETGQAAAKLCGLNIIAQLKAAAGGDLDRVKQIVRLGGFVNCAEDFKAQPLVINGASDLMQDVFGEVGRHARAAVGTNALPGGTAVEIDAIAVIT
jgi:enamine deaminase RidA (YjgF/YER057c/UK114 family)